MWSDHVQFEYWILHKKRNSWENFGLGIHETETWASNIPKQIQPHEAAWDFDQILVSLGFQLFHMGFIRMFCNLDKQFKLANWKLKCWGCSVNEHVYKAPFYFLWSFSLSIIELRFNTLLSLKISFKTGQSWRQEHDSNTVKPKETGPRALRPSPYYITGTPHHTCWYVKTSYLYSTSQNF